MNKLSLKPGELVTCMHELYRIVHVVDFEFVMAKGEETGELKRLSISDISLNFDEVATNTDRLDIAKVTDEDWECAQGRFEAIRPLIEADKRTVELVEQQAKKAGVHRATVYRWLDAYERSGMMSSLLPIDRSVKRGSRLPVDIEAIIQTTIQEFHLTQRKPSVKKTCNEVKRQCINAGISSPHPNTIRNRIKELSKKERVKKRLSKQSGEKYDPIMGKYPDAKWILSVVQIDHTPANIIIVDEVNRKPIGRPWLTVAIDVYSRMVAGLYVSLNPPGADSTGLCMANTILPKNNWLASYDIKTPWPVWGLPDAIHMDNAKEFRGKMLRRAAYEYGMDIYWRPVARPKFGAHIERLLGTFKRDIETLPGTTFANPRDKGDYKSDKEAAMTLAEFEKWLVTYITEVYHQQYHNGIDMAPIKKWTDGVFGTESVVARGLPDKVVDTERLYINFLPYEERTVQSYGIALDEIQYYSHVLNRWIHAEDPDNPKLKRKFIVRRNPRDISFLYFYDPELNEYFEIPYRDSSRPGISLWELREARRKLKEQGIKDVNEDLIFDAYERMRQIADDSVKETKKIRRANQRRKNDKLSKKPKVESKIHILHSTTSVTPNIMPFDELEELE